MTSLESFSGTVTQARPFNTKHTDRKTPKQTDKLMSHKKSRQIKKTSNEPIARLKAMEVSPNQIFTTLECRLDMIHFAR